MAGKIPGKAPFLSRFCRTLVVLAFRNRVGLCTEEFSESQACYFSFTLTHLNHLNRDTAVMKEGVYIRPRLCISISGVVLSECYKNMGVYSFTGKIIKDMAS